MPQPDPAPAPRVARETRGPSGRQGRPGAGETSPPREPLAAQQIHVLLVDDHRLILELLGAYLGRLPDMQVVGTAESLRALAEIQISRPDVVLMDYHLVDGTGAEGCRIVKARWPQARIVMLTGVDRGPAMLSAVEAGADGYLVKSGAQSEVVAAIRAAYGQEVLLSPEVLGEIARGLGGPPRAPAPLEPLTPRELTVLKALALGRSTATIATDLGLRPGTVRVHVEAIRRKFHVSSKLEAVSIAIRHGVVEVPSSRA